MVERLSALEKCREDRGVVAKECEQYAERLVGYVRKRLLILIGEWLYDVRRTMCCLVKTIVAIWHKTISLETLSRG